MSVKEVFQPSIRPKKNFKKIKQYQSDLVEVSHTIETYTGRIIRNVNSLAKARDRRKRIERSLAKELAAS